MDRCVSKPLVTPVLGRVSTVLWVSEILCVAVTWPLTRRLSCTVAAIKQGICLRNLAQSQIYAGRIHKPKEVVAKTQPC